jgi:hypothetical protein
MLRSCFSIFFILLSFCSYGQDFRIIERVADKKVDILYGGELLTSYCYFDSTAKPILFPIKTVTGVTVTRGFPIAPRAGERTDHPHHTGLWLNYESVNGLDFWNNSYAIPPEKKSLYGSIVHGEIRSIESGKKKARLVASGAWIDNTGNELLREVTEFIFSVSGNTFVIDRTTTLTGIQDVVFKDVKDGMLGMRVARELELPSDQSDNFVDAQGNVTTVARASNEGVTGMYVNREGIKGDDTWGKRSEWTYLTGTKDGEQITIGIIDHPSNIGYPTYWHARGYGLFAANPLGQKVFSNGKEEMNLTIKKDEHVTFRYRILVHSGGEMSRDQMDQFMKEFSK